MDKKLDAIIVLLVILVLMGVSSYLQSTRVTVSSSRSSASTGQGYVLTSGNSCPVAADICAIRDTIQSGKCSSQNCSIERNKLSRYVGQCPGIPVKCALGGFNNPIKSCTQNSDCATAQSCQNKDSSGKGTCAPKRPYLGCDPNKPEPERDDQCINGNVCGDDGQCHQASIEPTCGQDRDCVFGTFCGQDGKCVTATGTQNCSNDYSCFSGQKCISHKCQ